MLLRLENPCFVVAQGKQCIRHLCSFRLDSTAMGENRGFKPHTLSGRIET